MQQLHQAAATRPYVHPRIEALAASKIREVANAAMGDPNVLAFWFGEPDQVTPAPIRAAASRALDAGDTFYHANLGIPSLREAIARYLSALHRPLTLDNIAVTSSGVNALMLVHQALLGPGDRAVFVTPVWPNLTQAPRILGADVVSIPLEFRSGRAGTNAAEQGAGRWQLDLDRLIDALTPQTRVLVINSPNNPTGWTIDAAAQRALLAHCRKHGIWIVADDVYERVYYGEELAAPSFLAIAADEDRVISTNSFSKSWLMTGWRLGWIAAPTAFVEVLPKLIEYNTSCAPGFVQQAGEEAIRRSAEIIPTMRARMWAARDHLFALLREVPQVEASLPPGAMYLYLRVLGVTDSLQLAKHLVRNAKLGLAPGIAFGTEGEGFLRWCFAASDERLSEGVARLRRGLAAV